MLGAVKNYLGGLLAIVRVQASSKTIKSKISDNGARSVSLHKIDYGPKNGSKIDFFYHVSGQKSNWGSLILETQKSIF